MSGRVAFGGLLFLGMRASQAKMLDHAADKILKRERL